MASDCRRQLASEYLQTETAAKVITEHRRSREIRPPDEPVNASGRPLAIAWITDELIAEHRRMWSGMYGRDISESEAIEIILNIKRLAEAIMYAVSREGQP